MRVMAELDDRRLSRPNTGAGRMQRLVSGSFSSMGRPESSPRPAGSSSMSSRAAAWSGSPRVASPVEGPPMTPTSRKSSTR